MTKNFAISFNIVDRTMISSLAFHLNLPKKPCKEEQNISNNLRKRLLKVVGQNKNIYLLMLLALLGGYPDLVEHISPWLEVFELA